MNEIIDSHLKKLRLDLRKKGWGYSRYMDQKVTPDVLSFIADCVINFIGSDIARKFTRYDIWESHYFEKNIRAFFGKPSPTNKTVSREYDKFIGQPLKMLAYAGVIQESKQGGKNTYAVISPTLLQYIALRERNAFMFISSYVRKVMKDSGFLPHLQRYEKLCKDGSVTEDDFQELKSQFLKFMIGNTEINGKTEVHRIFPKVINPYAVSNGIPGTERGHMTKHAFVFADLMYNRTNFRDLKKDKAVSRQEAAVIRAKQKQQLHYNTYRVHKAMNIIKKKYRQSEVRDSLANEQATQVHHIFPDHRFPDLSDYTENLIKLTPQQHNTRAHPHNRTREIDKNYQLTCLVAKADSIEQSLQQTEFIYSKQAFIHVINTGLQLQLANHISFDEIRQALRSHFSK